MTYPEAIQFLYGLRLFGTKLGLDNTLRLAALFGSPQSWLKFIHVAGTNGKGSTCAMLESVYRTAGFKTGLFTSPHLVSFTERLQVNRKPATEQDVVRLVERVIEALERENRTPDPAMWEFRPTFFECVTVMALQWFAEQQCDVIVWETGMGGRLDATNIVTPLASVITNVQLDHEQWLGSRIEQIAAEKAGIIKRGVPVITGADEPAALEVIRRTARERQSPIAIVDPSHMDDPLIARGSLGLLGEHQRWNAATALATIRTLRRELPVSDAHIIEGLAKVQWPGRLQTASAGSAAVLLDGAHNPDGARTLAAALRGQFSSQPVTLVLGLFQDKAWQRMCDILVPEAVAVYLVPVQSERSADPVAVREYCAENFPGTPVHTVGSLRETLPAALRNPFVVVAGSLHLVGEAMELLGLSSSVQNERDLNEWDAAKSGGLR